LTDLDEILKTMEPVILEGEFVVLVVGEGEVATMSPPCRNSRARRMDCRRATWMRTLAG
jgi:hypothetical protein